MTEAAAILALAIAAALGAVQPESGVASQYSPHLMERVVGNRQRMSQLPPSTDPIYMTIAGCIAVSD